MARRSGSSCALFWRSDWCKPGVQPPVFWGFASPAQRPGPATACAGGDRRRTRNHQPAGHTRLPGYARGRVGVVTAVHGAHVFPDHHAHSPEEDPKPLYTVQFDAGELYGADADPTLTVSIEAWEPYLDRSPA